MAETIALSADGSQVVLGSSGIRLRAPRLRGNVVWIPAGEPAGVARAAVAEAAGPPDPLDKALNEAGLSDKGRLQIPSGGAADGGAEQMVLDKPIKEEEIEFAIYRDEAGVISLHRPLPSPPTAAPPAGAAMSAAARPAGPAYHHYVIRLRPAAAPPPGVAHAMLGGGIFGRVIRFVGRAVTGWLGDAVFRAGEAWEDHYRAAQGFHWGDTVDGLLADSPSALTGANWGAIQGQKSLLFVHGTTSSTAGAFDGLKGFTAEAGALYGKYGNRVIGFNHHTLTKRVAQNALDFLQALPAGNYSFDVITHSRGGLLARALKEMPVAQLAEMAGTSWTPPAGLDVQIGKIALVGTPDQGTPLADPADLAKAVSRMATIATSFAEGVVTLGLGALLTVFGAIIDGGLGALPGLEDMNPGSPLLQVLNAAGGDDSPYYAIAADYQPSGGLKTAIENDGFDALFLGKLNDLVVPTVGVAQLDRMLGVGQIDSYAPANNVCHVTYFRQQETWGKIVGFLPSV